jgi:hypothetical protein
MNEITESVVLQEVEHILGSGSGVLDFAVAGESDYRTWWGTEDADWHIEDTKYTENADEDRFIIYPISGYFVCEIEASGAEGNAGPVRCYCE